jgi:hypothetical protein
MVLAAEESLADILARSKLGMAMDTMIRMIATTISSSINEKPFSLRIRKSPTWNSSLTFRYLGAGRIPEEKKGNKNISNADPSV